MILLMADAVEAEGDPKPEVRTVRVGLPGGTIHEFNLPTSETIATLVSLILEREKLDPNTNRVRIISSGKLVNNHSVPLTSVLNEGSFLHAAISEGPPQPREPETEESDGDEEEVPLMLSAVDSNGEVRIIIPNLTSRGFERLAQAGFSEDEIRLIRHQFNRLRREVHAQQLEEQRDQQEAETEERDIEAQEIDEEPLRLRVRRTDPRAVLTSGAEGTNGDFLLGCIIGYMVGIMVLVFLLDSNATRRWRVGILAGVATNAAFGVLRTSLYVQQGPPPFA